MSAAGRPGGAAPGNDGPRSSSKADPRMPEGEVRAALRTRTPVAAGPGSSGRAGAPDRAQQAAWVRGLRARDAEALREVVRAFSERITAVVCGILRDRDAVEDVVQETFTKAWFRIGSFQGE